MQLSGLLEDSSACTGISGEVDVGILSVSTRVELPKSSVVSALFT